MNNPNRAAETVSFVEMTRKHLELMRARLDLWESYYPHRVKYIDEEALAQVEKREPRYIPPTIIG